ncbi:MAG TPA: hypothetical protein VG843_09230 [Rhizomicrobium sp.]|nr:hypothetical protein [Rhizomicrobium sp.]
MRHQPLQFVRRALTSTFPALMGAIAFAASAAPAAAQSGDVVASFTVHNDGDQALSARVISFGQVFRDGTVFPHDGINVEFKGKDTPAQIDAKALNKDGSIRHAIVTVQAPKLDAHGKLAGTLLNVGAKAPEKHATLPVPALDVDVTVSGSGEKILDLQDIAAKHPGAPLWIDGPLAQERRYVADVNDHLEIFLDVWIPVQGPARVDVSFHNDWANIHRSDYQNYDVDFVLDGKSVSKADGVSQYPFSTWHRVIWTDKKAPDLQPRVVPAIADLIAAGAVPSYDPKFKIASDLQDSVRSTLHSISTAPLSPGSVTQNMPNTGGRWDIGLLPTWTVIDLKDSTHDSRMLMLANADAAGSIPWHIRIPTKGNTNMPATLDAYPTLWLDPRGGAYPGVLPEAFQQQSNGWTIDNAHQPSLVYVAYLLTGSQYYRDELEQQAAYDLLTYDPDYRGQASGYIMGTSGQAWEQVRDLAWTLRTVANASYVLPTNHKLRHYYNDKLENNLSKMVDLYSKQRTMKGAGELEGWMPGNYGTVGATAPWQQSFLAATLAWSRDMGFSGAGKVGIWMTNFLAGLFTNKDEGFDPERGACYYLDVEDPNTLKLLTTWKQAYDETGLGSETQQQIDDDWTAYGWVYSAGVGAVYYLSGSPTAGEAYNYVRKRAKEVTYQVALEDPTFVIVPRETP